MTPRKPREETLEDWRRRIDAIDCKVVDLLNERAGHALALGLLKRRLGLPIYQPEREEQVLQNVQGRNAGPLGNEALRRLFERIIDESRRLERVATERPETGGPGGTGETGGAGDGQER